MSNETITQFLIARDMVKRVTGEDLHLADDQLIESLSHIAINSGNDALIAKTSDLCTRLLKDDSRRSAQQYLKESQKNLEIYKQAA